MAKGEEGMALNPTGQQDPNRRRCGFRKVQLRIYGLVAGLVLTIVLIVVLERVNKSLPDGSKTRYDSRLPARETFSSEEVARRDTNASSVTIFDPSGGSNQEFVPVSTASIIASQCPTLPPTCECPPDEIFNCNCVPDPSVTFCTCTVKMIPSCTCDPVNDPTCNCDVDSFYRDCVCPPDSKCSRCTCLPSNESCPCPVDPFAAGCDNSPRPPQCNDEDPDECGCSVIQEWQCRSNAEPSNCTAAISTIGGAFSSIITFFSIASAVNATVEPSSPTFITLPSSGNTLETTPTTLVSILVTSPASNSNISEIIPMTSSLDLAAPSSRTLSSISDPTALETDPSALEFTSSPLPSSGSPSDSTPNSFIQLTGASPSISSTLISPIISTPETNLSTSGFSSFPTNSNPMPTAAVTFPDSDLLISSTATSSNPSPFGTAFSTDAISQSPVTSGEAPASSTIFLGSAVIILVSSSLVPVTGGSASFSVVAVTFLQTTLPPSASIVTGSFGDIFTIPSQILSIGPTITTPSPGIPPVSLNSVPSVRPNTQLAPPTTASFTTLTASTLIPSTSAMTTAVSSSHISNSIPSSELNFSSGIILPTTSVVSTQPGNLENSGIPIPSLASSSRGASPILNTLKLSITAASQQVDITSSFVSVSTMPSGSSIPQPSNTPDAGSNSIKIAIYSWPVSKTVLGGYVPLIIARVFIWGWTAIMTPLSAAETMHQLARSRKGSSTILFGTGTAHWYFWPGHIATWLISPFTSELIYFDTNYNCPDPNLSNPSNPCWPPIISVNTWVSRVLETFIALVAATLLVLIGLWFKRPSSRAVDPTSIATVAVLMGHPEVERDFKAFDADISIKELKEGLKDKRYQLGTYHTEEGTERYGIVPVPSHTLPAQERSEFSLNDSHSPPIFSRIRSSMNFATNWKKVQLGSDIIFLAYLCGIIGAAIFYVSRVDSLSKIHLFNNSIFGPRFLFAILACIASSYWNKLQRDAQTLAPYVDLAYPNTAPPSPTILLRTHSLALTALIPLLRHKHFIPALTAFIAILSEFLIITFSGLPYRPGQLRSEFLFCAISSLVILALMIFTLFIVILWRIFRVPDMPRKPESLAAVMSYLCDSAMVREFEGLEFLEKGERNAVVRGMGRRFVFGERRGGDGRVRWVVDFVEGEGEVIG